MGNLDPEMSDELMFVNAFIGFCRPMAGTWPNPLGPLGYEVVGVEKEIGTILLGQPRIVVPELLCASPHTNHTFWLEAKTRRVPKDQAARYQAITNAQLVITGLLPVGMVQGTMTHDTIYVSVPANAPSVVSKMSRTGVGFPVVTGDWNEFVLFSGRIAESAVDTIFRGRVVIQATDEWPRNYVKFNHDVSAAQIAPTVVSSLAAFIMGTEKFSSRDVAERCIDHWKWCGSGEQSAFANKIHGIVDLAQREELQAYFEPVKPPRGIRTDPRDHWRPKGERPMNSNAFSGLQRAATAFSDRTIAGLPYRKGQPPLTGL